VDGNSAVKNGGTRLLSRREFNERCVALSSLLTLSSALALDAATAVASTGTAWTVKFRDGTIVPAIGQGSAGIGQGRHPAAEEEEALRTGLSLGMTIFPTASEEDAATIKAAFADLENAGLEGAREHLKTAVQQC
jgi:hypothetical protein